MNLIQALEDPELFGDMGFDAPSWASWRTFLTALWALPMDAEQLDTFRKHTGRMKPPKAPSRYAELVTGRRGGKTRILALVASYQACCVDHRPFLAVGERAVVACIAKDRAQARVLLNYIGGFLKERPLFARLIESEQDSAIHLNNGVSIEVHTATIGSPRGRTFCAVLCDEIAFWTTGDGANPDIEIINAVRPGSASIPHSLLLIASSPYAKKGVLYTNYAKHYGKDDAPVMVWKGSTEEMNSSLIGDPLIAEMYAEDPERARAEFGAEFRSDIEQFISRETVEGCVTRDVSVRPPLSSVSYRAFVDPSGGSSDSMTLAVAHREDNHVIIDCVLEKKAPFHPDQTVGEFAGTLKQYKCAVVTGDRYAGEWPAERFAAHGIRYEPAELNRSELYLAMLPLLNSGKVDLLDNQRLTGQLCGLERRTARSGKDSVDHAPGAKDDVANAVAGACVLVGAGATSVNVSRETAAAFGRGMAEIGRRAQSGTLGSGGRGAVSGMSW